MANKVLFVDDDSTILHLIRRTLKGVFDLDVATDGAAALRKLQEDGPFAVVVSDLHMPGMDGLELLERVKAEWPETVRLLMTSEAAACSAADGAAFGDVFRLLSKPYDLGRLEKTLGDALILHRSLAVR